MSYRNRKVDDPEWGDRKIQEWKDECAVRAGENTKECPKCDGFVTTNGRHFREEKDASQHQYDIERRSSREPEGETLCFGAG